jgi:hypothetical protein
MIQRLIFSFTPHQYSYTPALQLNYNPKNLVVLHLSLTWLSFRKYMIGL